MKDLLPAFLCLLAMAGCSGSSSEPAEPAPAEPASLAFSSDPAFAVDSGDQIALTADETQIRVRVADIDELVDIDSLDPVGRFTGGFTTIGGSELYVFHNQTAGSSAGVLVYDLALANGDFRYAAQFARLGETVLPSRGSATYTGDYVGFLYVVGNAGEYRVQGDAELIANFDDGRMSGAITGRNLTFFNGVSPPNSAEFVDITMENAEIDANGAFTGDISGGEVLRAGDFTEGTGTYQGLIAGSNSEEVVGGIDLTYETTETTPRTLREIGVFSVDQ